MRINSGLLAFQPVSFLKGEPSLFLVVQKQASEDTKWRVPKQQLLPAAAGSATGSRGSGQNPGFCGRWSCLGQIKEQNSHTRSGGTTGLQMRTLRYRSILYRINDTAGPCARQCQHHNPCSSMLPDLLLRANLVLQTV